MIEHCIPAPHLGANSVAFGVIVDVSKFEPANDQEYGHPPVPTKPSNTPVLKLLKR